MIFLFSVSVFSLLFNQILASTLLSPQTTNPGLPNLGFIVAGRGDADPVQSYSALVNSIQASALKNKFNVYASVVQASIPLDNNEISNAVHDLRGVNIQAAQTYFLAHSMSSAGVDASQWVYQNPDQVQGGLVLLSAFLPRTYRPDVQACLAKADIQPKKSLTCLLGCLQDGAHDCYGANTVQYPVPVLTIGGDVDGVVRVTRIAEAFYTQTVLGRNSNLPVVILPGVNHAVLLGATPSASVTSLDLVAEVTPDQALSSVSSVIASWITGDTATFNKFTTATSQTVQPIIDAFVNYEGNWWFTGADEEHGSSPWAAYAQELMAKSMPDGTNYKFITANEFHMMTDEDKIPPYFRQKHRPVVTVNGNTIQTSTVAQLRFTKFTTEQAGIGLNGDTIIKEEKLALLGSLTDDGSDYVSALEISTKLASRQFVYNQTGVDNPPDSLDDGDRCKAINQAAYNWALQRAGPAAAARFSKNGLPMFMQADQKPAIAIGPYWIWTYLDITTSSTGAAVTSYYAFYDLKANPYGAGNHYCKLLSPARALEWIYVDGLRAGQQSLAATA